MVFIPDARAYVFQNYKEEMRNIKTIKIKLNYLVVIT